MSLPIRQTSSNATISLIFGVLSYFLLPFIGAVIAVICGHMARAEIRRSQGALDGDGMAVAGLILGYVHLGLCVLAVLAIFLFLGGIAGFLMLLASLH
ncbi:MAG: DUF4190 domain-containing protein [Proteobacteria bacterium]|nr:DUF4190 domain-containing protein [Pseudomonadota bacterium]MBS0463696.1 DUF4190 domain-containing protein [Pseudomonadota bacterium]